MGFLDKFTEILRDNDEDEFDDFMMKTRAIPCRHRPKGKSIKA